MVIAEVNNVEFIRQVGKTSHGIGFQPVSGGIAIPLSDRLVIKNPKYKSNFPTIVEVVYVMCRGVLLTFTTGKLIIQRISYHFYLWQPNNIWLWTGICYLFLQDMEYISDIVSIGLFATSRSASLKKETKKGTPSSCKLFMSFFKLTLFLLFQTGSNWPILPIWLWHCQCKFYLKILIHNSVIILMIIYRPCPCLDWTIATWWMPAWKTATRRMTTMRRKDQLGFTSRGWLRYHATHIELIVIIWLNSIVIDWIQPNFQQQKSENQNKYCAEYSQNNFK